MSPRRDDAPRRKWGRVITLVVASTLAVAATGMLVLTDDQRVLRLAVVVALWAFVLGAIAGVRRQPAGPVESPAAAAGAEVELRRAYQAELERETEARREFQAQFGADLRRALDEGLRQQVEVLRGDVRMLHEEVLERLDGELRVERVAWHGESTRLTGGAPGLRGFADGGRRHTSRGTHAAGGVPTIGGDLDSQRARPQRPGLPPPAPDLAAHREPPAAVPAVPLRPAPTEPPPAYQATPPSYQPPPPVPPAYQPSAPSAHRASAAHGPAAHGPAAHEPAAYQPSGGPDAGPAAPAYRPSALDLPVPPPVRAQPPPMPQVRPDPLRDPLPPSALGESTPFERTRFGSDTGEFVRPSLPPPQSEIRYAPARRAAQPAPAGPPPAGQSPAGPPLAGPPPAAPSPTGQPPTGQSPTGQSPAGPPLAGPPRAGPPRGGPPRAAPPPAGPPRAAPPAAGSPPAPAHHAAQPTYPPPPAYAAPTHQPAPRPPERAGGGRHAQPEAAAPQPSHRRRRYREEGEENDVLNRVMRDR